MYAPIRATFLATMLFGEGQTVSLAALGAGSGTEAVRDRLFALKPATERQEWLRARALETTNAIAESRGVRTARGGKWHVSNVKNLVDRLPASFAALSHILPIP